MTDRPTNAELITRVDEALEIARVTPVTADPKSLMDIWCGLVKTIAQNWPDIKAALTEVK